jgi:hypothetical protein
MNEPRDSEDGTVEKEEVIAGQSDAHTSDEGSERYGVRHSDGIRRQQRQGKTPPHSYLRNCSGSIHVLSVDGYSRL